MQEKNQAAKSRDLAPNGESHRDKRACQRLEAAFPVNIAIKGRPVSNESDLRGLTTDLSEKGAGLVLDNLPPLSSVVDMYVDASPRYKPFRAEAEILWNMTSSEDGLCRAGLRFLKIDDGHLSALKNILSDYGSLDNAFVLLIKEVRKSLLEIKGEFDAFDRTGSDAQKQIDFIETNKKAIFGRLDDYFHKIWEVIKDLEKDRYTAHQNYYIQVLGCLLLDPIETNRHVYQKPLGYSGDYIMMNYIYDYHGGDYLGGSAYEKLINHYTCNIPISNSNILRKDFLKDKILEALEDFDAPRVLSLAAGPCRELLELLRENRISKPLVFKCLDFEKSALDHINSQIKKIEPLKKQPLSIEYISSSIASLIRDKELKAGLGDCGLIYAFGIFDYLSDRMASRLTKELFHLLAKRGKLIIFNISSINDNYRAYYELLGEWSMIHRTEEEMLSWTKGMGDSAKIGFESLSNNSGYLCLSLVKR